MSSISPPLSRSRFSFEQAVISLFIGLLIFFLSLAIFVVGSQVWFAGRIFPGVKVGGVDVGGMRIQEAAEQIAVGFTFPQEGKILLRDGEQTWVVTPAQLGLYINPQTSASNAYKVGRTGWMLERLRNQYYAWYNGQHISPDLIYDQRATYAYLAGVAKEIDLPTIEASLKS